MGLLAVYSICGISRNENFPYYVDSISSLLAQKLPDLKIAISGCMSGDGVQQGLRAKFGSALSYNFVEEELPLSVTFNDTIDKCVKHYGPFEGYLYIDSGINFWDPSRRYDSLDLFWGVFKSDNYGILAAYPSNDDGASWWKITYPDSGEYVYSIGQTTNMHCQIFSEKWRLAYNRILPDIFASNCMESVFSHMCGAIHQKFGMTQKIHVLHAHSMDGASMAARRPRDDMYPMSSIFETSGKLFKTQRTMDERYRDGKHLGFGFEEYQEYWRHDPTKYDNGFSVEPALKDFLAKELYLNKEELDYEKLKANWIPGV